MWSRAAAIAIVAVAAASAHAQPREVEERTIELRVGEQTVISADKVDKYSEGVPGVVEVRLPRDGKQFVIVALAQGKTTLLLLMKDGTEVRYTIQVREGGVKPRDNIRLDFYFVQLQENGSYRVGIGWPGTVGGAASVTATRDLVAGSTSATASVAAQVLPRIDLAAATGWAKIRRQATIIVANGELGRFSSGGEMNFRVEGNLSSGVQAIPFGSEVEVTAMYDRTTGRIEVRISADVSELTAAGPDGLPGRTVSRVSTLVNLELGECIVLAGLHSESEAKGSDGVPLLHDIPVLGYLFGSKNGRTERTENILFIVPTVVEAVPLDARDRVLEAYTVYRRYEGELGGKRLLEPAERVPAAAKEAE